MSGDEAFRLYDSLGVPLDFMEDIAGQRGLAIDREGFERAMEGQRERARAGSAFKASDKGLTIRRSRRTSSEPLASAGDQFAATSDDGRRRAGGRRCSTTNGGRRTS